jgi:hypothetical protein
MMDKVYKPSDSESSTPSSEPFRFSMQFLRFQFILLQDEVLKHRDIFNIYSNVGQPCRSLCMKLKELVQ